MRISHIAVGSVTATDGVSIPVSWKQKMITMALASVQGQINKREAFMQTAPGDCMGYNPEKKDRCPL